MTGFVDDREERVAQVVLAHAGGDAHVADREARGEGVRREVQAAAVEVITDGSRHLFAKGQLCLGGEMLLEAGVIGERLAGDGLDDRHQLGAQRGEDALDVGGLHARVGIVDERVGDVVAAGKIAGELARKVEVALKFGQNPGIVIGGAGLGPGLVAARDLLIGAGDEFGRHVQRLVEVDFGMANQAGVVGVSGQRIGQGQQVLDQFAQGRVDRFFGGDARQHGQLRAARFGAARRHAGELVPVEQGGGVVERRDVAQAGFEFVELGVQEVAPWGKR